MNNVLKVQKILDRSFILIFSLIYISLSLLISYFGNPITDESFPFAIAIRFIQGQKPFVDDYSPFMSLGILLLPIVKLSLLVHHGKNELILFMRHSFIFFQLLIALYAFFSIRKYLPDVIAFVCAALIFIYHPFGINSFHYDTLCTSLWAVIVFQGINFVLQEKSSLFSYFSFSFLCVLLSFSYPTFAFYLVIFCLYLCFFINERKQFLLSNLTTVVITIAVLCITLFNYDVHFKDIGHAASEFKNIFNIYQHEPISHKFISLSKPYISYVLISLCCLMVVKYFFNRSWILFILTSVLLISPFSKASHGGSFSLIFYFLNCIGFLSGLLFIVFLTKDKLAKLLFYLIWLPSLGAGLLTAITSSNGVLNFNVGFFPTAILVFVYSYQIFKINAHEEQKSVWLNYFYGRLILTIALITIGILQAILIYGANPMNIKQYKMAKIYNIAGPFKGLHLDSFWYDYYQSMQDLVKKIDVDEKYIYFGPFSGGYLLVDKLKPADYLLFCPYWLNHFNLSLRVPSYAYADVSLSRSIDKESYIPSAIYKKISQNPYYELYYASKTS